MKDIKTADDFTSHYVPYIEISSVYEPKAACQNVLSGALLLIIEDIEGFVLLDIRTYPVRGVSEPEDERVLRGARDGFVETIVFNTSLIRRRIRDENLIMDIHTVGKKSKTDVVICYLDGLADKQFINTLTNKIKNLSVDALTMGQESLAEALFRYKWYNPFPKIRYTERPDCAAANILEGKIIIIVDNSPSVLIFPTSFFDFLQETDDYYFPPLTGSYLRILRTLIFITALILTPLWFLLIKNPNFIPPWLEFIKLSETPNIPPLFQLLILEAAIDGLKLASLNTPNSLGSSLSIIGGLILGEYAIKAGWFSSEIILYMAFVAIATFTQPSYELAYAFKFMRVIIIVLTAMFNLYGFIAGILLTIILISLNKTIDGKSYLYPLIPFNGTKLKGLLLRVSINSKTAKAQSNRMKK
ncbi:MAG: spore germination protein [Oscillospiraceae bacterium]